MSVRGYQLSFDWSRAGTYAGTGEDVSSKVNKANPIVVSWGRNTAQATDDAEAGKMDVALLNTDRRFSPENTSSPIAGKVMPGTTGRLLVTHPVSGATSVLFSGPLDTFSVDTTSAEKTWSGTCLDGWGIPGGESLSTAVYQGQRTGTLIGVVLDSIGWTGGRDIDPGNTLVPWWWEEDNDAATAIKRLVDSEGPSAIAYVKGGTFVFRDRSHRIVRSRSITSQGTFTRVKPAGSGPAGDYKMIKGSFSYDHGLSNIANSVTFQVEQRTVGDPAIVWQTDQPISLGVNEVVTLIAQSDNPFIGAFVPVQDTDYTVLAGTVSISLSRDSGQTTFITLTAGAGGVAMTGLALRASPITVTSTSQVRAEDTASINAFRRQKWQDEVPWANAYDALAIAQKIVAVYSQARPTVVFRFVVTPSQDATTYSRYLAMALAAEVSDRITVREDEMGLNADFIIERVSHEVRQLGIIHSVELSCQVVDQTQPANVFTFDVAGKGFNDGLFGTTGLDSASNVFLFDTASHGFNDGLFAT